MPESTASQTPKPGRTALMLPGGGARGAYQVGVLKALAEISERDSPFPIITGTSAGAINAAVLASHGTSLRTGVERLEYFWSRMRCHHIYRTDLRETVGKSARWLGSLALGSLGIKSPRSLLDNEPLRQLLQRELRVDGVRDAIERGALHALAITASGYSSARAVSFFQGHSDIHQWQRPRRVGLRANIAPEHLLASAALPFIFPAAKIGHEFYGDGGMRHTAPLSTPIHLGASKLLIIGTRDEVPEPEPVDEDSQYPSIGEIGGYMLDIIFMDNLQSDLTRLNRVNHTLSLMAEHERRHTHLQHMDTLLIKPSEDVRAIADRHHHRVPGTVRFMLSRAGAWGPGMRLPSFLLFEGPFCRELIELGYHDAQQRRAEIEHLLAGDEG